MTENPKPFFGDESIKVVKLKEWMEWASGKPDAPYSVVLPMIQRGSVWAPHKLLDLWDTLLRGMPVGAMMASEVVEGMVQNLAVGGTSEAKPGTIGLVDGQQRTLSMMAGWPQGLQNPLRPVVIWIDLTDKPQGEYQFRMWITTKAQPFGYTRAGVGGQPLSKLERGKLRLANKAWEKMEVLKLWSQADFIPWEAKFALPLSELVENQRNKKITLQTFVMEWLVSYAQALQARVNKETDSYVADKNLSAEENAKLQKLLVEHFAKKLQELPTEAKLTGRISALEVALQSVLTCEFPAIHVRKGIFDEKTSDMDVENTDPPLAILFKRVGTGGEKLSDEDYIYSVIKHHAPKVHDMVEALLKDAKVRAIYKPTTLVMSAVRMTMLALASIDSQGKKVTDSAKLDKAAFARMVRNHPDFIEQFQKDIQPDGAFSTRLKNVLNVMSYTAEFKTGLPKHALRLVPISLLETILAWHTLHAPAIDARALKPSSLSMVRFILQGNLCILNYADASEVAVKALKEGTINKSDIFPDQALMSELCRVEKAMTYALPSPDLLGAVEVMPMKYADGDSKNPETTDTIWRLTETPEKSAGLRGWTRFAVLVKGIETDDAYKKDKQSAEIYKRWWNRSGGHVHLMLLWLQRDYIHVKFEHEPALAGMEDETPYDFDHIAPSAHWVSGTGTRGPNRLMDFSLESADGKTVDKTAQRYIGNSIGNVHVLDSSDNRSFGDTSASIKLEKDEFAKNALILDNDQKTAWITASGIKESPRHWDKARALAFQSAVERRAFGLYKSFYTDLKCGL